MPKSGKEQDLKETHSIGGAGVLKGLVEYAKLNKKFFKLLLIQKNREIIRSFLIKKLKDNLNEHEAEKPKPTTITSPFPHEQQALRQIFSNLEKYVELIPNYELYDQSTNQYLECDLIIISTACFAVVELKHWGGSIDIEPHNWRVNGRTRKDPHRFNVHKCKVLKSWAEKQFPFYNIPWVESIVVLTNPDADISGAANPSTEKRNPTFDGVHALSHFFIPKLSAPNPKITKAEAKKIADALRHQSTTERPKGITLPDYEILENLTESPRRIELLARPTGLGLERQRVHRLRLFTVDASLPAEARDSQRNAFSNSLKALISLDDHPNILRVWRLSNDEGVIIEASEWSDDGTLADVVRKWGKLPFARALPILRGILEGLRAVHDRGIVHRNLTPENILMISGVPKLMNFDLSYIPEDNRQTVLDDDAQLDSSPYIAPELYAHQDFTEATDLFSVGVIAFRLLRGEVPFESGEALLTPGWELPGETRAELRAAVPSDEIAELIECLLQPDRLSRYQKAADVLADLDRLMGSGPGEATPTIQEEPNRELQPGESERMYYIERLLGRGREAQVYLARKGKDRKVALKLFNHDIAYDRVIAERRVLDEGKSPYVVRCETEDQWADGRFFLVLDFIDGLSLRHFIKERSRPDLATFKRVSRALMEAIAALHQKPAREPLLHNDLKPDNILLADAHRPVIIDFGAAGPPRLGPFVGTPGYFAPDLFQGADYDFCESGDLFSLTVTLFEWLCGARPYPAEPSLTDRPRDPLTLRDDLPEALSDWLLRGVSPGRDDRFPDIRRMRRAFEEIFHEGGYGEETDEDEAEVSVREEEAEPDAAESEAEPAVLAGPDAPHRNPFVDYLNTLHNTQASNEGALAETQACSAFFGSIHVILPLTEILLHHLIDPTGGHVVLTGHAGDGKSTIGLEIFKRLKNLIMIEPLSEALKSEEAVDYQGLRVFILKDMSELTEKRRRDAFRRMLNAEPSERFLLISNTGKLLETLRDFAGDIGQVPDAVEDHLLHLLQQPEPCPLEMFNDRIQLVNLTQVDNIGPAAAMFKRMIGAPRWAGCEACDMGADCPIFQNRRILNENRDLVAERIAWIYRRLYEYGHRLTMRQISAHLAYGITSGMSCGEIRHRMSGPVAPPLTRFLFHNRFFGFKGDTPEPTAERIVAIRHLMPLEMGANPYPDLDRRLWTSEAGLPPAFSGFAHRVFNDLASAEGLRGAAAARRRQEIRRLYYLFCQDAPEAFFRQFIQSAMLVEVERWQDDPARLNQVMKNNLRRRILHVLQEQFTGFHVPDGTGNNTLFITLSRRNEDLRQSVQLLLAKVPFDHFRMDFDSIYTNPSLRRFRLRLRDKYHPEIVLNLGIPFLDFVMSRSAGRVGGRLNRAYLDRLERFKELLRREYGTSDMALLELTTDGRFKIRRIQVSRGLLAVY